MRSLSVCLAWRRGCGCMRTVAASPCKAAKYGIVLRGGAQLWLSRRPNALRHAILLSLGHAIVPVCFLCPRCSHSLRTGVRRCDVSPATKQHQHHSRAQINRAS